MVGKIHDWSDSRIYQRILELEKTDMDPARRVLSTFMPDIQTQLKNSAFSAKDFTLHDDQHGFRVAETMVEITPDDVFEKMGALELALLLLAAYLHDMGMSPNKDQVDALKSALKDNDLSLLTKLGEDEIFKNWMTVYYNDDQPPLSDDERIAYIASYYARERHNDWAEKWVRDHMCAYDQPILFNNWQNSLIDLCKSHHQGLDQLKDRRFNSFLITGGQRINLRYLACLLRVADILEVNPDRTPDILIQHRQIHPDSLIYWQKDKVISMSVEKEKKRITISATLTPSSPRLHRAALDTIEGIDRELRLCQALKDDNMFPTGKGGSKDFHRWDVSSHVVREVRPSEDYEFIDGAFRPDAKRVLALLGDKRLYGDPVVAVRELLQNAFDGVREKVAYQRLEGFPLEAAQDLHQVTLRLLAEDTPEGEKVYYLECRDSGIGMNKTVIEKCLLVSGAPKRPDLLKLERRCRDKGFASERTGEFGIGALSYFMLADQLSIETLRSTGLEDGEAKQAWRYESHGMDDFGGLYKIARIEEGTTIRLRLKPQEYNEDTIFDFAKKLDKFLQKVLVHLPCKFSYMNELKSEKSWSRDKGWCPLPDVIIKELKRHSSEEDCLFNLDKFSENLTEVLNLTRSNVEFLEVEERIEVDDVELEYRLAIPVYKYEDKTGIFYRSLVCFPGDPFTGYQPLKALDILRTKKEVSMAWRGMRTSNESLDNQIPELGTLQINFVSGGKVSVDRETLEIECEERKLVSEIINRFKQYILQFDLVGMENPFARINQEELSKLGCEIFSKNLTTQWIIKNEQGNLLADFIENDCEWCNPEIQKSIVWQSTFYKPTSRLIFGARGDRHQVLSMTSFGRKLLRVKGQGTPVFIRHLSYKEGIEKCDYPLSWTKFNVRILSFSEYQPDEVTLSNFIGCMVFNQPDFLVELEAFTKEKAISLLNWLTSQKHFVEDDRYRVAPDLLEGIWNKAAPENEEKPNFYSVRMQSDKYYAAQLSYDKGFEEHEVTPTEDVLAVFPDGTELRWPEGDEWMAYPVEEDEEASVH